MLSKGNKMFVLRAFIYLYYFRNDEKWRSNWIMMHNILLSSHLLKKEPIYYKSFAAVMIPHWFIVHNHDSMKENYAVYRHENLQLCLNVRTQTSSIYISHTVRVFAKNSKRAVNEKVILKRPQGIIYCIITSSLAVVKKFIGDDARKMKVMTIFLLILSSRPLTLYKHIFSLLLLCYWLSCMHWLNWGNVILYHTDDD